MKLFSSGSWARRAAWLISIVFHPVFVPFYTLLVYFEISPYFFYDTRRILRLLFLSAVLVPLMLLFLLYRLKILCSFFLERLSARAGFSVLMALIYGMLYHVLSPLHPMQDIALYFKGIMISLLLSSVFFLFHRKISLHALAAGGTWMFFLIWSYLNHTNILSLIVTLIFLTVLVLVARLELRAHTIEELAWGLVAGMAGQWVAFGWEWEGNFFSFLF